MFTYITFLKGLLKIAFYYFSVNKNRPAGHAIAVRQFLGWSTEAGL